MTVSQVKETDVHVIRYIAENLLATDEHRPSIAHLQQLLADDRTYLFASFLDTHVTGYALAYRFPSLYAENFLAYLYDIEVVAQHRRKGIGRLLMKALLETLKKDGVKELFLGTATDNAGGQALFAVTGGIRSGETFNDFTWELG